MNKRKSFRLRTAVLLICALVIQLHVPVTGAQIKVADTTNAVSGNDSGNNGSDPTVTVRSASSDKAAVPSDKPATKETVTPTPTSVPSKSSEAETPVINISKPTATPVPTALPEPSIAPTPVPTLKPTSTPVAVPSSQGLSDKEDRAAGGGSKFSIKKAVNGITGIFNDSAEDQDIQRDGAGGDTTWQNDYDYSIADGYIILIHYKGSNKDVVVPDKAVIDGSEYTPTIRDTTNRKIKDVFSYNTVIESVDLRNVKISGNTSLNAMFSGCTSLKSVSLNGVVTKDVYDLSAMFWNCKKLTTVDLGSFDTSNVRNMKSMFINCNSLTSLDLSNFNTSEVTDMSNMFSWCTSLTSLDLSNFNTGKVTDMNYMFYQCTSLTSLDLSNFNTGKVTDMSNMFYECSRLTSLDLSNFNTSEVTDMSFMFSLCSRLTSLDLSNFNTSEVTNMDDMFDNCLSLTSLDLSSFNMEKVYTGSGKASILGNCSALTRIEIPCRLNLDVFLPATFVKEDNPSDEYNSLPRYKDTSFTIILKDTYTPVDAIEITGDNVEINDNRITIYKGRSYTFSANVTPFDASSTDVTWSVTDESTVSLVSGNTTAEIKGLKAGETRLRAVSVGKDANGNSKEAYLDITVAEDPDMVTGVEIKDPPTTIGTGTLRSKTLEAVVSPSTALNKKVSWSISPSDGSIATISEQSGGDPKKVRITGVAESSSPVTVTVTTEDGGQVSSCRIYVVKNSVEKIEISSSEYSVPVGGTLTLADKKAVYPEDATVSDVTYTSDNTGVATVNESTGLVTGIAPGTAHITVASVENPEITATFTITVYAVPVTGVTLNRYDLTLLSDGWEGETVALVARVTPDDATNKEVIWRSTSSNVASVDSEGNVTAKETGEADIIVTTVDGGKTAICHVTVEKINVPVTGITLIPPSEAIYVGDSVKLEHSLIPSNATDKRVTWTSDSPETATVVNGLVTGVSPGTTTIRVKARDGGYEAHCTVIVRARPVEVTSIELDPTSYQLYVDENITIKATVKPDNAYDKTITWKSNNPTVATVTSDGVVTAKALGEATITATASNGVNAICEIKVIKLPVRVKEMYISPVKKTIYVGQGFNITATILPTDADIKDIIWSSDNDPIAAVNEKGRVTGKKVGTAIITALTADGGLRAECEVTVKNKPATPTPAPVPTWIPKPGDDEDKNKLRIVDDRTKDCPSKDKVRGYLDRTPGDWYLVITDSDGATIKPRINADSSLTHHHAMFFKIRMLDAAGNEVKDFGKFTIRIPLISDMDLSNGDVRVVAVNGDGLDRSISSSTGRDGDVYYVTFTSNHNGEYAILYTLKKSTVDYYNNYYRALANQYNAANAAGLYNNRVLDHVPRTGYVINPKQ